MQALNHCYPMCRLCHFLMVEKSMNLGSTHYTLEQSLSASPLESKFHSQASQTVCNLSTTHLFHLHNT